jgi:hypothetical protein
LRRDVAGAGSRSGDRELRPAEPSLVYGSARFAQNSTLPYGEHTPVSSLPDCSCMPLIRANNAVTSHVGKTWLSVTVALADAGRAAHLRHGDIVMNATTLTTRMLHRIAIATPCWITHQRRRPAGGAIARAFAVLDQRSGAFSGDAVLSDVMVGMIDAGEPPRV